MAQRLAANAIAHPPQRLRQYLLFILRKVLCYSNSLICAGCKGWGFWQWPPRWRSWSGP
jgi:hypothetical protein